MNKSVLLVGGVIAAGVVLVLFLKNQQAQQTGGVAFVGSSLPSSTADTVSGALASVGGILGTSSLGDITSAFGSTAGGNNDPGLIDPDTDLNDPGLESDDDF